MDNMEHPAFAEAGADPGLEIWTIDQFEPVPVDKKIYGKFYNGDCYIVLKTTGRAASSLTYDAHFWIGSASTQDKMGTAAILTVTLDDMLGGKAVHHREVQGHESSQFLGYFQPAIRYLEGGSASGFKEVEINAGADKRLLRLSGCENMRIEEVPAEASSLTKEHCFILEVEHDIFVLMPETAKVTQRRKIIQVANTLRDEDHNGRATIEIIDEFSSDEDIGLFFEALGSGSPSDIAEDEADGALGVYKRDSMTAVYLLRVLTGDFIEQVLELSKPYKQSQLASDEIYILDTPDSGIYVWLGKEVDADWKKNYHHRLAQKYLESVGYPAWTNVTRVSEGSECSNFKQYFHKWDDIDAGQYISAQSDAGYFSEDADEAAAARHIGKSAAARAFMPESDPDHEHIEVYRFAGEEEDVTDKLRSETAVIYSSEVYLVDFSFTDADGEQVHVIYIWNGSSSQVDDKRAAVALAAKIEDDYRERAIVVSVPQGKEPRHFLSIFKGNLVVLFGSKDNGYKPDNSRNTYEDDGVRFFRVEGTEPGVDMRVHQLKEKAELLEDDDVFVLETAATVYVWIGKDSDPKEQQAALTFVSSVVGDKEVVTVEPGDEPEDFWDALGGKPSKRDSTTGWQQTASRRVTTPPSLTAVNVTVTGKIKFEELPPDFTQKDLSEDGIYILDVGEELYLWQGGNMPERMRKTRFDVIKDYISDDGLERTVDTTLVVGVKQGKEPAVFKNKFPEWDSAMWENQTSYEDIKKEAKAANSK